MPELEADVWIVHDPQPLPLRTFVPSTLLSTATDADLTFRSVEEPVAGCRHLRQVKRDVPGAVDSRRFRADGDRGDVEIAAGGGDTDLELYQELIEGRSSRIVAA